MSQLPNATLYRITPACAGSTQDVQNYIDNLEDHPRLRGEYESKGAQFQRKEGSPPLARGVPMAATIIAATTGITPACAGSTASKCKLFLTSWDHPRLRGEYEDHPRLRGEY